MPMRMHGVVAVAAAVAVVVAVCLAGGSDGSVTVDWLVLGLGDGNDMAQTVAVDEHGTTYVIGTYHADLSLQSHTHMAELSSPLPDQEHTLGYGELFVAAFDASGGLLWSTSSSVTPGSGPGFKACASDAWVDHGFGLYVSVSLRGAGTIDGVAFDSADSPSDLAVLLKFVPDTGALDWSTTWAPTGFSGCSSLAFDIDSEFIVMESTTRGNITAWGYSPPGGGPAPSLSFGCPLAAAGPATCALTVAYNALGSIMWSNLATPPTTTDWVYPTDVTFGVSSAAVYTTGSLSGCMVFSAGEQPVCVPDKSTQMGVYVVARKADDGSYLWGEAFGTGPNSQSPHGTHIAADKNGNLYVVGTFRGGDVTLGTIHLVGNPGTWSAFIMQLQTDATRTVGWAEVISSDGTDMGSDVRVSPDSNDVLAVGVVDGDIVIQGVTVNVTKGAVLAQFHTANGDLEFVHVQEGTLNSLSMAFSHSIPPDGEPTSIVLTGGFLNETTDLFDVAIINYADTSLPPSPPPPPTTTAVSSASSGGYAPAGKHKTHVGIAVAIVALTGVGVAVTVFAFLAYRMRSNSFPHERLSDLPQASAGSGSANFGASSTAAPASGGYGAL